MEPDTAALITAVLIGLSVTAGVLAPIAIIVIIGRIVVDIRARRRRRRSQTAQRHLRSVGGVRR